MKVFGELINSQNYYLVTTEDVHSNVAAACINNFHSNGSTTKVHNVVSDIVRKQEKGFYKLPTCGVVLVSPDAGSEKKVRGITSALSLHGTLFMTKVREKDRIVKSVVTHYEPNLSEKIEDKTLLLVDDICDGGGTFISAAQSLRAAGYSNPIFLYVTHGFFTKGVHGLKEYFKQVYSVSCYNKNILQVPNFFEDAFMKNEESSEFVIIV